MHAYGTASVAGAGAGDAVREARAQVDGIDMRWLERGDGVPVVLVHGIPTSPELWRQVMPRVRGARVLAWEMVGYGQSIAQGVSRDISIRMQARYLSQWLDAMGLDRVVLVGHDLGGGVVQRVAVADHARCAGLLLTNAIGYDSWPVPSVKMLRAMGALVARLPDAFVRRTIFRMLMLRGHRHAATAREAEAVHWPAYAANGAGRTLIRQMRALDVRDTLEIAPQLPALRGVPARIVWGAADRFQKLAYGRRFATDLQAPLQALEGGKHFTPEDHPDALAEAINALVVQVQPAKDAAAASRGSSA
jgi:pimeloyl-ACP methyl ester carboxylesterase